MLLFGICMDLNASIIISDSPQAGETQVNVKHVQRYRDDAGRSAYS